ncbi:MAG: hypothetical protein ABSC04_12140 [Syntrophobacteraceae bacterium]
MRYLAEKVNMSVTATEVFDFLERHNAFTHERHEVSSRSFSNLRRNLRMIIVKLTDAEDSAKEISDALRIRLSEWLTVPVHFDDRILEPISLLGDPRMIEMRWGADIQHACDSARIYAKELQVEENPVRTLLRDTIRRLMAEKKRFRIFCHRLAKPHFQSISGTHLQDDSFIHTNRQYRDAGLFDVLIKVGPFRSRGWSAAPDGLLTSPRFETLVQIVWSGCGDEQGFGLDPVTDNSIIGRGDAAQTGLPGRSKVHRLQWDSRVERIGDSLDFNPLIDEDEFQIFQRMAESRDKRAAVLAQIDEQYGLLLPPRSQVLSFDPEATDGEQLAHRLSGENLIEGMFIILPFLEDVDTGGLQARDGRFSPIWKERLSRELEKDSLGLCRRLRDEGINLMGLSNRVEHWRKPPTTVIPAPQMAHHFEILIKVLGIDGKSRELASSGQKHWWQYAWNEIRRSRGEAIQAGQHEQDKIDLQTFGILKSRVKEIQIECEKRKSFKIKIPPGAPLQGNFGFFMISAIEEGFLAPETALKLICELSELEQWRV